LTYGNFLNRIQAADAKTVETLALFSQGVELSTALSYDSNLMDARQAACYRGLYSANVEDRSKQVFDEAESSLVARLVIEDAAVSILLELEPLQFVFEPVSTMFITQIKVVSA